MISVDFKGITSFFFLEPEPDLELSVIDLSNKNEKESVWEGLLSFRATPERDGLLCVLSAMSVVF